MAFLKYKDDETRPGSNIIEEQTNSVKIGKSLGVRE